ncbi:hypothetical protein [Vibrio coralliilyticus]|nr:hypothetical protein [Vibrio coralliilyticus]
MKACERRIQRDYAIMPKHLRNYFIFEDKWFGFISSILGVSALINMTLWSWFAIHETWLVGGNKLLTEKINTLPSAWLVIVSSLIIVIIPKIVSAIARHYYLNKRNQFSRS